METGVLLTTFISWFVGFLGILQFVIYHKYADASLRSQVAESFAYLWLSLGFIMIFTGFNYIFLLIHSLQYANYMIYAAQTMLACTLIFASWHILLRANLPIHIRRALLGLGVLGAGAFLVAFYFYGFESVTTSFFSIETRINNQARLIYSVIFIPLFVILLYSLIGVLSDMLQGKAKVVVNGIASYDPQFLFTLISGLSILVLSIAGTADELSIIYDWAYPVARLVTLIAAMLAYFAISTLNKPTEEVVV